jgi:hypothetical protein
MSSAGNRETKMTQIDWNALVQFIGYGPTGPVDLLFLGLEEKAVEQERNLAARSAFKPVEDLRRAHEQVLAAAGCHNPFADARRNPVKQWNTAARFALVLNGSPLWDDPATWSAYWRNELGRTHGSTFLMECFPFPRASRGTALPGRPPASEAELWLTRRDILRNHVETNPVKFAVAYGKATKAKANEIFALSPGAWRAIPGLHRDAAIASNGHTCVVHVGFFGRGLFAVRDIPVIVSAMRELARES